MTILAVAAAAIIGETATADYLSNCPIARQQFAIIDMADTRKILWESRIFRVVRACPDAENPGADARDIIEHPGAVVILPMVDEGHVCLIENYRIAVRQTLVELPAGTLEKGEQPIETAHRELAEETGFRASTMEPLCEFFMSPGILQERMHLFLATGLTAGEPALEPDEVIQPRIVTWADAVQMAMAGGIQDAKSLTGILLYEALRRDESDPVAP